MTHMNALFQLGMDLAETHTSTTQTEGVSSHSVHEEETERKDFFVERDGKTFAGTHLIIDLVGAKWLDDVGYMERVMRRCVEACGATLLHIHLHHFTPNGGVSGVAVLAESHISVHTWPERDYAAFDVFMCGEAEPQRAVAILKEAFAAEGCAVDELLRGEAAPEPRY